MLGINVMELATGEFFHKLKGQVKRIRTDLPEDLWVWEDLGKLKAMQHLAEIKKRAPFARIGRNGNGSPKLGSKSTQAKSGKSNKLQNSQAIKPAKNRSPNGPKKGKSNTSED